MTWPLAGSRIWTVALAVPETVAWTVPSSPVVIVRSTGASALAARVLVTLNEPRSDGWTSER